MLSILLGALELVFLGYWAGTGGNAGTGQGYLEDKMS